MCNDLCGVSPQGAAANPDSEEQQQKLREAAEGLRMATNAAAQNAIKKRLVNKLEVTRREEIQKWVFYIVRIMFCVVSAELCYWKWNWEQLTKNLL